MKSFPFLRNLILLLCAQCPALALADSVAKKAADNSVEAEMASFKIHDDFEINLFADESMGIANPVAMQWDARGRLWVLTTLTYAQLEPGQKVNDKLLILEDTNRDGKADSVKTFLDGLDMPMGFALGYGGVYVGEGPNLLFFQDTDGDDKADTREVVLTGFGTGDTHQNISNFTWGQDGCLYFSQGLHAFSRVETPWGIVRGDTAGFFRFHPRTLKLEPFCFPSLASQNPCGIAFDRYGAMFLKSNNKELIYVTPGLVPTTHQKNLVPVGSIGSTPGKSMGAEYVEATHLPDWLQRHILVAGYFSHRVTAFSLEREGAGFQRIEPVEILSATHQSFRPVEIKVGPDGAIYVADWFNPIIGHYQASLRHPDRDYQHGRIWRLTAKDHPLDLPEDFLKQGTADLGSPNRLERDLAQMQLIEQAESDPERIHDFMLRMVRHGARGPIGEPGDPHRIDLANALPLVLGILYATDGLEKTIPYEVNGKERELNALDFLRACNIPEVRALTVRYDESGDVPVPFQFGTPDCHPRVTLERVLKAGNSGMATELPVALRAIDGQTDRFIDYALEQTIHSLAESWVPEAVAGNLRFRRPGHLAFALEVYGGPEAREIAQARLAEDDLRPETRARFACVLARVGTPEQIRDLLNSDLVDAGTLRALAETAENGGRRPAPPFLPRVKQLIESENLEIRAAAIELAGRWKVQPLAANLVRLAKAPEAPATIRVPAMHATARLQGAKAIPVLEQIAGEPGEFGLKRGAVESLVMIPGGLQKAADLAARNFTESEAPDESTVQLLVPFLNRKNGTAALAGALKQSNPKLNPEMARHLAMEIGRMGRNEPELLAMLNEIRGVQTGAPAYSPDVVQKWINAANRGNPENGKKIFQRAELTCVACHQLEGVGGILGPSLDTVGAGLPMDILVESVLWPDRQLKEGYFAISVTTKDGTVFTGYEAAGQPGILNLRDTATGKVHAIRHDRIAEKKNVGTLMPAGLTNSLKEKELADLLAFLASLKG
ncbi:MAG: c-type cytochrome [Verrucomicrobiales bacterium]|nr:c-type cytochrome [Verrucomicrobiales bacterium]